MAQTRMAICLTDPSLPDNPIVFANRAFHNLTGYAEEEIVGRNCRFMQGRDSDPASVARMRSAIEREDVVIVEILNYRRDGTSFWNALHIGPVYDDRGKLIYFFGSQWDVSDLHVARAREQHAKLMARELSHRMKNMFSVIGAIVNVTGRGRGIEEPAAEITSRIQALGRAYDTTLDNAVSGTSSFGQAVRATLAPFEGRISMTGAELDVPFGVVSSISLILHELAANAAKYGAWSGGAGHVDVSWREGPGRMVEMEWRETGGPPVEVSDPVPGTGTIIIDRLLRAASGQVERHWHETGLVAVMRMPKAQETDGDDR